MDGRRRDAAPLRSDAKVKMAVKIIKQDSPLAKRIRPFSFEAPVQGSSPETAEIPAWMRVAEAVSPMAGSEAAISPAVPLEVNLAEVEKAAYERGVLQGEQVGRESAEAKLDGLMRRYADALCELGKVKSKLYKDVERQVVKLSLEVARRIVHREIQADREIVQTLVRVALSHAAEKSAVTVHLNPVDYDYLVEHKGDLLAADEHVREVVLFADKAIERGGCVVRTQCGDVDARIEEEFRELERGFFEGTTANQ